MWKNFGNTSTKIKMFVAIALLVGVGVTTYIATGVDNGDGSGEPSLAVPDGDAGKEDSAKATESKAEPKGVTEKTEAAVDDNTSGNLTYGSSYGMATVSNASHGGTRMLFGGEPTTVVQNTTTSSSDLVNSVQVVSVSSDGEVKRVELAVNQGEKTQAPLQKEEVAQKEDDTKKEETPEVAESEVIAKVDDGEKEVAGEDNLVDGNIGGDEEVVGGDIVNDDEENNNEEEESEAERSAREEAERQAREEAERQAREEAERQAREEAERQAREEEERRKELENAGNVTYVPINDYPWQNVCPSQADTFMTTVNTPNGVRNLGGYVCECVSYAAWKVYLNYGVLANWGDAKTWDDNARMLNYRVDNTPEAGAVGQTDSGYYGHVFWVEYVNADGSIVISDYNDWQSTKAYTGDGHGWDYGLMTVPAYYVSQYNYIHFK